MHWAFRDGDIAPYNCEIFWPAGKMNSRVRRQWSSYKPRSRCWRSCWMRCTIALVYMHLAHALGAPVISCPAVWTSCASVSFLILTRSGGDGQSWKEFLAETLSGMLGHLAANLKSCNGLCDQEVFVVGFHGEHFHIARGYFKSDVISRVYRKGCSEFEEFELKFTRGYDLRLRQDWVEAVQVLSRLFRYLLSGNAKR